MASLCRDFEIIPATSSRVCCGDEVATFRVATRALQMSKYVDKFNLLRAIFMIFSKPFMGAGKKKSTASYKMIVEISPDRLPCSP